jgi:hypothetical protein
VCSSCLHGGGAEQTPSGSGFVEPVSASVDGASRIGQGQQQARSAGHVASKRGLGPSPRDDDEEEEERRGERRRDAAGVMFDAAA